MLWVQKPHFKNHYLGVLPVTLKPVLPCTPIFTTLYWLLVVSQIKLKPNKVFRNVYHVAPLSIFSAHVQVASLWALNSSVQQYNSPLEDMPQYFSTFIFLLCYSSSPGKPFLFIFLFQSFKSQHKCSLHHGVSLIIIYTGHKSCHTSLNSFHILFFYVNFLCFL